ncbi:MAG: hypothetical protein IJW40_11040 [Clostridia bacterium]|nr:hypothetical protein [Clostridia bacterium]
MKKSKMLKRFTFAVLVAMLFVTMAAPFSASAATVDGNIEVMPLLNNTLTTSETFVIDADGTANVRVSYVGYDGVTRSATVRVKIQKKVLFWWSDVDNGLEDNTWVIYMSGVDGSCIKTLALEDTGSYRAVIEYTITGSGGADDIIPATLYDDYK